VGEFSDKKSNFGFSTTLLGYLPMDPKKANLFFQLISKRYEVGSIILTSNRAFDEWGDIFGDEVIAAAIIDYR